MSSLHSFLPASCLLFPPCLFHFSSSCQMQLYSTSLPVYSYCCCLAMPCTFPYILFFTFSSLLSFIWVMNNFLANSRAASAGDLHTSAVHSPKYQFHDSMAYKQLHTHTILPQPQLPFFLLRAVLSSLVSRVNVWLRSLRHTSRQLVKQKWPHLDALR